MTTLPPPGVKGFPEDSLEKKVYAMVDKLDNYLPVANDRNRLAYCLFKYLNGEGDTPEVLMSTQKLTITNIDGKGLASLLETELKKIKPN